MALRSRYAYLLILGFLLALGCNGSRDLSDAHADPIETKPDVKSEVVADWLKQPRAELAKRGDALLNDIRNRENARRKGNIRFSLLPRYNLPLVLPAFQELAYDADRQISVPAYARWENDCLDLALATQYARFGDYESALRARAGRSDAQFDAYRGGKNFPIEWTRLVALELHHYQQRIAMGEKEALVYFLDLRGQVAALLDAEAKSGWLGQALLACGKRTLELASAAWKTQNASEQVECIDQALATWPADPGLAPWQPTRDYFLQACAAPSHGRLLFTKDTARPWDLLNLPFPRELADSLLVFLTADDKVEQIVLGYTARAGQDFVRASDLASVLGDLAPINEVSQERCTQNWNGIQVETQLSPAGTPVGAWVRLTLRPASTTPALRRSWAGFDLDLTYENNRLRFTPHLTGSPIVVKQPDLLGKLVNPLEASKLKAVELRRCVESVGLDELRLDYQPATSCLELAKPLFESFGPGTWSLFDAEPKKGRPAGFRLEWQDPTTTLRLEAFNDNARATELSVVDRTEPAHGKARRERILEREAKDRAERLKAEQAIQRLPRKLEQLPLGMDKNSVRKYLPQGQAVYKRDFPGGLLVVNNGPPAKDQSHMVRQYLLAFDDKDNLSWIQVRFEGNPISKDTKWPAAILSYWTAAGGTMEPQASPYALRARDLPEIKTAPSYFQWSDDLTAAACRLDAVGVEVTLGDRDTFNDKCCGVEFLPLGPDGGLADFKLGAEKADLVRKLGQEPKTGEEGAWVIASESPAYDALLVWFEKDKVRRIAARHRQAANPKTAPKDMEKALITQWGAVLKTVGWPARRDYVAGDVLQAFTWFDASNRFRLYWAESDNSPSRLWSEWARE